MKALLSDNTECKHGSVTHQGCWHGPCVVALVFDGHEASDGSFLLRNGKEFVKRFPRDQVRVATT